MNGLWYEDRDINMKIVVGHINEEARRADEMSDLQQVQPSERRGVVQWMLRGSAACFF